MYLATLSISNFRRLQSVKLEFQPGLNVIVGPNNIGKTAVVDALRALLAGADDPYPKFTRDDLHLPKGGAASGDITFEYVFRELSPEDEADFLHALRPGADDKLEAVLGVNYGDVDKAGRLRPRRWCGDYQDVGMASTMLENLRSVYLQPLRDAEQGLRPSRNSQLSRLLHLLSDDSGKEEIASELTKLDAAIKKLKPIVDTQNAIAGRHKTMLGDQLAQALNVELTGNDFQKLAARLSLLVDAFEIERNGLGYNNLIFMAVVLSELAKSADAAFRSLIVEEPEAHLHPQLQAVLLRYLSSVESAAGEKACPSLCDYTHASARYWVLRTLKEEPFVLRALVRRYPHILVDEAQDIGPEHEAILELMVGAGSQLSLIGDSNQGIYEFTGANGVFLAGYGQRLGVTPMQLNINYRSVPAILNVANKLSGRSDKPDRTAPTSLNGAFYIPFKKTERDKALATFRSMLASAEVNEKDGVVVCRSSDWADTWSGGESGQGQGIVKSLAEATISRDKLRLMEDAYRHACAGIVGLLADEHRDLISQLSRNSTRPEHLKLRRAIWSFVREPETGLPSGTLLADTEWHPLMAGRAKTFVAKLSSDFGLRVGDNLGQKLAKKALESKPLIQLPDLAQADLPRFRVSTVHKVKGESLAAVMYVASKEHVRALLDGTTTEVGRIGYVAVTRARNLFVLAVPDSCLREFEDELVEKGFQKPGVGA